MPPPGALVCGHVTLDRQGASLVPGGAAYYAGRAFAALGAAARVFAAAGADFPRDALAGVEAALVPAAATNRFANTHDAAGARTQRVEAAAPPLDPLALPAAWRAPDVLLLAPVLGEVDVGAFLRVIRAPIVGLCPQGLVRAVATDGAVVQPPWSFDAGALAGVHAVCLGDDDVRGQGDLVARLAATVPVVAFTHGARGCEVIVRGRSRTVGVFPAREVDPTGAGDVFAAGFLLALARGEDPVDAARLAAAAASIAVEGLGGDTLGRLGEAAARAAQVPVLT